MAMRIKTETITVNGKKLEVVRSRAIIRILGVPLSRFARWISRRTIPPSLFTGETFVYNVHFREHRTRIYPLFPREYVDLIVSWVENCYGKSSKFMPKEAEREYLWREWEKLDNRFATQYGLDLTDRGFWEMFAEKASINKKTTKAFKLWQEKQNFKKGVGSTGYMLKRHPDFGKRIPGVGYENIK